MHVLVVGGGIAGLSTAWALARDHHKVEVFDQGTLPNLLGASHDQQRLIRYFYPDRPGYCRMVDDAFEAWERLWTAIGRRHYAETGALAISVQPGDWTDRARQTLDEVGIAYDRIEGADVARRWPFLLQRAQYAIRTRKGGALFADRILTDLIAHLAAIEVQRHAMTTVASINAAGGSIKLADGTVKEGDAVVLAGGAWVGKLAPALAERVTPVRNALLYLEPPVRLLAAWATAPTVVDCGGPSDIYAVPPVGGTDLKFGIGAHRRPGDPDRDRTTPGDEAVKLLGYLRPVVADLGTYRIKGIKSCFYAMAKDERFILERQDKLWIVSACSGHGFKFGPLVGERVAEAVTGGDTEAIGKRLAGF